MMEVADRDELRMLAERDLELSAAELDEVYQNAEAYYFAGKCRFGAMCSYRRWRRYIDMCLLEEEDEDAPARALVDDPIVHPTHTLVEDKRLELAKRLLGFALGDPPKREPSAAAYFFCSCCLFFCTCRVFATCIAEFARAQWTCLSPVVSGTEIPSTRATAKCV